MISALAHWIINRLEYYMCTYGGPCLEGTPAIIFVYVLMMCFAAIFIYYDRGQNDQPGLIGVLAVVFWPLLILGMFVVTVLSLFGVDVDGNNTNDDRTTVQEADI